MRFDVAKIVIWIFELPLDQERRAASHPYLARLRTWLGSSRHRRRPKWIRSWRETACFPSTTQPVQESLSRFRSILNRITEVPTRQHVPFVIVGLTGSVGEDFSPLRPEAVLRDKRGERPKGGGNPSFAGTRADDEVAPIPDARRGEVPRTGSASGGRWTRRAYRSRCAKA